MVCFFCNVTATTEIYTYGHTLALHDALPISAAVMGQVADEVFAIERHEELASLAKRRMESLGYDNVTIIHGDGTKGLPASAPFDAIIAAASGPDVPKELTRQLTIGGRLVMPVGDRKSVVEGKSVSVRVDLGGRRIIKKKKQKKI